MYIFHLTNLMLSKNPLKSYINSGRVTRAFTRNIMNNSKKKEDFSQNMLPLFHSVVLNAYRPPFQHLKNGIANNLSITNNILTLQHKFSSQLIKLRIKPKYNWIPLIRNSERKTTRFPSISFSRTYTYPNLPHKSNYYQSIFILN